MSRGVTSKPRGAAVGADPLAILQSLPDPMMAVDGDGLLVFVNAAAEQFFATGASHLIGRPLADLLPFGSPVGALIDQARQKDQTIREYGIDLGTPRIGWHSIDAQATPVQELAGHVVLTLRERSIARMMDKQFSHRAVWRSVTGMAAVLAHEVKNPLSGIRGAAQLLEQGASDRDRPLTLLIRDEADRICDLVDRMEIFSEKPLVRGAVNIHAVLDHVRQLARTGFGAHIRFVERYDPSLPPVLGNRDQLVQVILNLVKNAAEANPAANAEITLATAFRHGLRMTLPGRKQRVDLPLEVTVGDNGPGIPDHLRDHLFDPFVSGKTGGQGLGLALVAKIVGDHSGAVEYETEPGRTLFRLRLPMATGQAPSPDRPW